MQSCAGGSSVPELTVKNASSKILQPLLLLLPGTIHVLLDRQWLFLFAQVCTQKTRMKVRKQFLLASLLLLTHRRTHHSYFNSTCLFLIQEMEIADRPFSFLCNKAACTGK